LSFLKFRYLAFSTSDPHRPINIRTRSVNVFWSSCATWIIIKHHRWNKRILIEIHFMYNVGCQINDRDLSNPFKRLNFRNCQTRYNESA
jgi:hypothetical protein